MRAFTFSLLTLIIVAKVVFCQPQVTGSWQTLSNLMPINPVHVSLLHTGKVLVVSGSGNDPSVTNYEGGIWDPQSGLTTTQPLSWDMFCNGMVILPDGRPFIMGGTLQYDPFHGWLKTSAFDPNTGNFVDLHGMAHGRWYPTATTLGDGRILVFSGLNETGGTNMAVEFYTVGLGWSTEYTSSWTPPLYPRMNLLPNGTVFYSGSTPGSNIFDPATQIWTFNVAQTNYGGTRTYGSSVLLPLTPANGYKPAVMIMGGGNPATATVETIDLSANKLQWNLAPPMSQARIEMNAVILPSGKILALGGSINDEDEATASLQADLLDPNGGPIVSAGSNAFPRLYHSVALLLPDATVWVAGGNPARGTYEQHMEIYSPSYLFTTDGTGQTIPATRPTLSSVSPAVIGYGGSFQVQTPDAADIASVELIRAGSVTHAFDMDQRLVGLSFTPGDGVLNMTGPPTGNIAPPGYYLLFLVNSAGVPSVAAFVQVSYAPTDQPPTGMITSPSSDVTIGAGQSVSFAGTASDPDGTVASYSWVFPGGSPAASSVQNPGAVGFLSPGTFRASLTATDNLGLNDPSPPTRLITVVPGFSLSATPVSRTVLPGTTTSYQITVTPGSGFAGTVNFGLSGLPTGASGSFNPATVSNSGSTTLSVATGSSTPPGSYPLTMTGNSGVVTETVTATLVVGGSFAISVSPASNTIARGASGTYKLTVSPGRGFSGVVTFGVIGLPSKTLATFNPKSVTNGGSSTLTVRPGLQTPVGSYTLQIGGVSGGVVRSAKASLTIQ